MKPLVIAPSDLADGFRLAGIPVIELTEDADLEAIIQRVKEMPEVALILVDERYMEPFERAFEGGGWPMIASFPSEEVEREETYIDELTMRYLGQKIYVEGESESWSEE